MEKTKEDATGDVSLDIAETVGRTIGHIVNRIEALDKERAELIQRLADARISLNDQFNKWLPAGFPAAVSPAGRAKREKRDARPGTPCSICGFATEPYHDGRLKAHRDQMDEKRGLTEGELEASGLRRI